MSAQVSASVTGAASTGVNALTDQCLTFGLGAEAYGVTIGKVPEIIAAVAVTSVPGLPPMSGVSSTYGARPRSSVRPWQSARPAQLRTHKEY
jgi:hypothetical protein